MLKIRKPTLLNYEILILAIYLISVVYFKVLRYSLPFFAVFASLPIIMRYRKSSKYSLAFVFVTTIYMIIGLVFQDFYETIATYISRVYQFVLLFILLDNGNDDMDELSLLPSIRLAVLLECFIDIITYFMSFAGGLVRLTSGNQPVGGNIAIVILPLLLYEFYFVRENRNSIIKYYTLLLICVIIAGTRGYVLMYLMTGFFPIIEYLREIKDYSKKRFNYRLIFFILLATAAILAIIYDESLSQELSAIFRVGKGTGTRPRENQLVIQYFNNTDMFHRLFGIGYGGVPSDAPGYYNAFMDIMASWGRYGYSHYLEHSGSIFHNYYSNILLLSGITGLALTLGVFLFGVKAIRKVFIGKKIIRRSFVIFWISFFIMLYYRWSCSCGISEMIILGYIIIKSKKVKNFASYTDVNHAGRRPDLTRFPKSNESGLSRNN